MYINLSLSGTWELRIDLQDFKHTKQFAKYSSFQVLSESEKYKLVLGPFTKGNAGEGGHYWSYPAFIQTVVAAILITI